MSRHFISIDLRQWPVDKCKIVLTDLDGNTCELDGLAHGAPHTHALVEIDCDDDGVANINLPGHLCDYHPDNGTVDGVRKAAPAPLVKRDAENRLIVTSDTVPHTPIFDKLGRVVGKRPIPPSQQMDAAPGVHASLEQQPAKA